MSLYIYKEVEVEVNLSDFSDDDLIEELSTRNIPNELLEPLKKYITNHKLLTQKDLNRWLEFCNT